jgi:hypothetical protein
VYILPCGEVVNETEIVIIFLSARRIARETFGAVGASADKFADV